MTCSEKGKTGFAKGPRTVLLLGLVAMCACGWSISGCVPTQVSNGPLAMGPREERPSHTVKVAYTAGDKSVASLDISFAANRLAGGSDWHVAGQWQGTSGEAPWSMESSSPEESRSRASGIWGFTMNGPRHRIVTAVYYRLSEDYVLVLDLYQADGQKTSVSMELLATTPQEKEVEVKLPG